MDKLFTIKCGADLHGTRTKDSDTDYKGVYVPSGLDIMMQRVKKTINSSTGNNASKNSKEDVDTSYYALHFFVEQLLKGEGGALDLLHAPDDLVEFHSEDGEVAFRYLQNCLKLGCFYTKDMAKTYSYFRAVYGELQKDNPREDWKHIAHGIRYGIQAYDIYTAKDYKLPLTGRSQETILAIKQGQMPMDQVKQVAHNLYENLKLFKDASQLPDKPSVAAPYDLVGSYYLASLEALKAIRDRGGEYV